MHNHAQPCHFFRYRVLPRRGCRPHHALTSTSTGIHTLDELLEDHPTDTEWCDVPEKRCVEAVHGGNGNNKQRITKTYRNGVSDTLKIKLQYNMELQSTPNHRWWVSYEYDPKRRKYAAVNQWREAQDIRPNDIIEVVPGIYNNTTESALKRLPDELHNDQRVKRITQPTHMTPNFGWLIGYMWGNGAQSPQTHCTRFTTQYREHLQKVKEVMLDLFGIAGNIHRASEGRDAWTLDTSSVMLWDFFELNGIWRYSHDGDGKKTLANIPRIVRESSVETLLAFFAGITDADGCVSVARHNGRPHGRSIIVSNAHEAFSRHFQEVALAVGLNFGRSHNTKGEHLQGAKSMWLLGLGPWSVPERFDIYARHSLKIVAGGRDLPYPHEKMTTNKAILGRVRSIETGPCVDTFDIEVDKEHWYYAGAVKSHNTLSLLAGVTPGAHPGIFQYFIRRIRIAAGTPLARLCKEHGYPCEPQLNFDGSEDHKTLVVSFPCAYPPGTKLAADMTAIDQLETIKRLQHEWSDNAVSVTIYYRKEELPEIRRWLAANYATSLKTCSFLLHSDHGFRQAPYEEITREEYIKLVLQVTPITSGHIEIEEDYSGECAKGVCPIK